MPFGYPAMTVPGQDVLRVGNPGAVADLDVPPPPADAPVEGPWVLGDLLELPPERLPGLDELEGFGTAHADHLYLRVMLPALLEDGSAVAAWTYVWAAPPDLGVHLPGGTWPPD